jgi:peptidoglycan/LPS O-acetylase OafA/YrhL
MLCPFFKLLNPFVELGYEAVPLFFLLSGFILSHNYFSEYSLAQHPKFVFLRFARLWPVHFVALMLLILSPNVLHTKGALLKSLMEELLMVRSWFHNDATWNAPAWSISAEWFAYICVFPLAFILFKRIRSVLCLVIIVMLFLSAQVSPVNAMLFPGPTRCGSIFFLFLAGSGLYRIRYLVKNPPAEAMVICGLLYLLSYVFFNKILSELILYIAFALLIFGLSYERGFLARILSSKIAVQGGLASYSLYMTHYLVIQSFIFYSWASWKHLPQLIFVRYLMLLLMAGVFIGTALVFYHYIEEPANRKLRRFVGKFKQSN